MLIFLNCLGLLSDGTTSCYHTATSFLKLLVQCAMVAASSQSGFAALLLVIFLSRSVAPICYVPLLSSFISLFPEKVSSLSIGVDSLFLVVVAILVFCPWSADACAL
jgi:hypothetical protein